MLWSLNVILIWRGWGLLGLVALFPMLAACAGLADLDSKTPLFLAVCWALMLGGVICVYFGTLWNRVSCQHSLYEVPLETCGWIYLACAGGLSLFLGLGSALAGLGLRRGPPQPGLLGMGVGGAISFLIIAASSLWLIRMARKRSAVLDDEAQLRERQTGGRRPAADEAEPGDAADQAATGGGD